MRANATRSSASRRHGSRGIAPRSQEIRRPTHGFPSAWNTDFQSPPHRRWVEGKRCSRHPTTAATDSNGTISSINRHARSGPLRKPRRCSRGRAYPHRLRFAECPPPVGGNSRMPRSISAPSTPHPTISADCSSPNSRRYSATTGTSFRSRCRSDRSRRSHRSW